MAWVDEVKVERRLSAQEFELIASKVFLAGLGSNTVQRIQLSPHGYYDKYYQRTKSSDGKFEGINLNHWQWEGEWYLSFSFYQSKYTRMREAKEYRKKLVDDIKRLLSDLKVGVKDEAVLLVQDRREVRRTL